MKKQSSINSLNQNFKKESEANKTRSRIISKNKRKEIEAVKHNCNECSMGCDEVFKQGDNLFCITSGEFLKALNNDVNI